MLAKKRGGAKRGYRFPIKFFNRPGYQLRISQCIKYPERNKKQANSELPNYSLLNDGNSGKKVTKL